MEARGGELGFWLTILLGGALTGAAGALAFKGFYLLWGFVEGGFQQSRAALAVFPLLGLLMSYIIVDTFSRSRSLGSATGITLAEYHTGGEASLRDSVVRSIASISTIGFGGAAGPEAPGIFLGPGILQSLAKAFGVRGRKRRLTLAGAAAGLAGVFKAPATSILYALEVPYVRGMEKEPFLEVALASVASYLVSAAMTGPSTILSVSARPAAGFGPIVNSVVIGALAGGYSLLFSRAYSTAGRVSSFMRGKGGFAFIVLTGGLSLSALGMVTTRAIGLGLGVLEGAASGALGVGLLASLLVLRSASTIITLNFGGIGELFTPMIIDGALLGALYAEALGLQPVPFYALIGAAAALAGTYKMLLSPVTLVAEIGGVGFIVPALLASGVSYAISLPYTLFRFQLVTTAKDEELLLRRLYSRLRDSEPMRRLLARDAMSSEFPRVDVRSRLRDAVDEMASLNRKSLAVVDESGALVGELLLDELAWLGERQLEAPVSSAPISRALTVRPDAPFAEAVEALLSGGREVVYVVDASGRPLGEISLMAAVRALMPYLHH